MSRAAKDASRHSRQKAHGQALLGFGPRFLHPIGQATKGAANTGVFLQVTCNDAADVALPTQKNNFSM